MVNIDLFLDIIFNQAEIRESLHFLSIQYDTLLS